MSFQKHRSNHALDGSSKKKAIDSSIDFLRQRMGKSEDDPFTKSEHIWNNADFLLKEVNTLYVSNLAPETNEVLLTKIFNKYGDVEFVKISESKNRKWAYVKYFGYANAYNAKNNLQEKWVCGQAMKIIWCRKTNAKI